MKVKVSFEFDVTDEKALREHFSKLFDPSDDAYDCCVGYFGLCAVEDGFDPIPGVELDPNITYEHE